MSGGVQSGVKRPVFPTLAKDPDAQRMLASINEVVSAMLNSGAMLGRVPPGPVLRFKDGQTNLAWGIQNRVDAGVASGIASLPAMRADSIGIPLYVNKVSPSGAIVVKATGKATDGDSTPRIDGSPTGIVLNAPGLSTFMADGQNWYSSQGEGVSTASQAVASGAQGVGEIQLHDLTYNPVGLWQFQGDTLDSSGNGFDATVDAGVLEYGLMDQRLMGARFNSTRLRGPSATLLAMRGDMTVEFIGSVEATMTGIATGVAVSYTGGSDDSGSAINYLYQVAFPDTRRIQWFSEHGVGVNDSYIPTNMVLPPARVFHCAGVRENSRVQFYVNGKPFGTMSPSLFAPTNGEVSRIWFGGTAGTGTFSVGNNFTIASMKLVPTALNAAAVRGEYNRTLGGFLGNY